MTLFRHSRVRVAAVAFVAAAALCACKKEKGNDTALGVAFMRSGMMTHDSYVKMLFVTAPDDWTLGFDYPEGTAPWCSVDNPSGSASPDGGTNNIWVRTGVNSAKTLRRATVTVACDGQSASASLIQFGTDPPVLLEKMELPRITSTEWLLAYADGNFMLDYSTDDKQARWVAWQVYQGCLGTSGRSNAWAYDGRIPEQYWPADGEFSGYQRGHLCPSGDRTATEAMNRETFYYTNMAPQVGYLNTGAWLDLENRERAWINGSARRFDTVFICAGGVFAGAIKNPGKLTVPRRFFKAVLGRKGNAWEAIAFVLPNDGTAPATITPANTWTIDELEELTGIDFFYNLDAAVQADVEHRKDPSKWGITN